MDTAGGVRIEQLAADRLSQALEARSGKMHAGIAFTGTQSPADSAIGTRRRQSARAMAPAPSPTAICPRSLPKPLRWRHRQGWSGRSSCCWSWQGCRVPYVEFGHFKVGGLNAAVVRRRGGYRFHCGCRCLSDNAQRGSLLRLVDRRLLLPFGGEGSPPAFRPRRG